MSTRPLSVRRQYAKPSRLTRLFDDEVAAIYVAFYALLAALFCLGFGVAASAVLITGGAVSGSVLTAVALLTAGTGLMCLGVRALRAI